MGMILITYYKWDDPPSSPVMGVPKNWPKTKWVFSMGFYFTTSSNIGVICFTPFIMVWFFKKKKKYKIHIFSQYGGYSYSTLETKELLLFFNHTLPHCSLHTAAGANLRSVEPFSPLRVVGCHRLPSLTSSPLCACRTLMFGPHVL